MVDPEAPARPGAPRPAEPGVLPPVAVLAAPVRRPRRAGPRTASARPRASREGGHRRAAAPRPGRAGAAPATGGRGRGPSGRAERPSGKHSPQRPACGRRRRRGWRRSPAARPRPDRTAGWCPRSDRSASRRRPGCSRRGAARSHLSARAAAARSAGAAFATSAGRRALTRVTVAAMRERSISDSAQRHRGHRGKRWVNSTPTQSLPFSVPLCLCGEWAGLGAIPDPRRSGHHEVGAMPARAGRYPGRRRRAAARAGSTAAPRAGRTCRSRAPPVRGGRERPPAVR
jgi:hypothetical protein